MNAKTSFQQTIVKFRHNKNRSKYIRFFRLALVAIPLTATLFNPSFVKRVDATTVPTPSFLYRFSGNYLDSSGNGKNGTSGGTATIAIDSTRGQVLSLSRTQNSYVKAAMGLPSSFTKAAWVKLDTSTSAFYNIISNPAGTGSQYLDVSTDTNGGSPSTFSIKAGHTTVSATNNYVWDTTAFPSNTWVHVALTFDGPTKTYKLYRNGTLISTNTSSTVPTAGTETYVGTFASSSDTWSGYIDDAEMWNSVLDSDQISAVYNGNVGVTNSAPATITDLSGYARPNQANLTWTIPSDNGPVITDYLVEYKLSTDISWSTFSHSAFTTNSVSVTGLTNASSYDFRVSAINNGGTATPSSSITLTPYALQFSENFDSLSLGDITGQNSWSYGGLGTWTVQTSGGGKMISQTSTSVSNTFSSNYISNGSGTYRNTVVKVDFNLTNTAYSPQVWVRKTANTGDAGGYFVTRNGTSWIIGSHAAGASATFATLATGTSTQTVNTGTWYTLELSVEDNSSGNPVIKVYVYPQGGNPGTAFLSYTDTAKTFLGGYFALGSNTNAVSYDNLSVYAYASSVPGTVADLGAFTNDGSVDLTWSAPFNGGSPISDYLIEYKLSSDSSWTTYSHSASTSTNVNISGLTNDSSYDFRVSAINASTTGATSNIATASPYSLVLSENFNSLTNGAISGQNGWVLGGNGTWIIQAGGGGKIATQNSTSGTYNLDYISNGASYKNQLVKTDFEIDTGGYTSQYIPQVWVRKTANTGDAGGYLLFQNAGTWTIAKHIAGSGAVFTTLATASTPISLSAATWYTVEFSVADNGSGNPVLSASLYTQGSARTKAFLTYTDTSNSFSQGYAGLGTAAAVINYDNFSIYSGNNAGINITSPRRDVIAAPTTATLAITDESNLPFYIPYIQTSTTLNVSADVGSAVTSLGGGAKFVLNEGESNEQVIYDLSSPFTASFSGLAKGTYTLDAYVVNSSQVVQVGSGKHDSAIDIGIGDIITAIGDSITEGYSGTHYGSTYIGNWLNAPSGSASTDNRNYPQYGPVTTTYDLSYMTALNNELESFYGYPVFIMNEGWSAYKTSDYITLMATSQWSTRQTALHPNKWLIHLGVNDGIGSVAASTVKTNLQTIITNLETTYGATGPQITLARQGYNTGSSFGSAYLSKIDELVASNNLNTGPDFYTYYQNHNGTLYADGVHPNVAGNIQMARLWALSLMSPKNVNASQSAGVANITWDDLSTIDNTIAGYKVKYGTTPGTYTTTVDVGNVTNKAISSLSNGQTYYFTVSAYDNDATSANQTANSSVKSLTMDTAAPSGTISINSAASITGSTSATLTISATDNVDSAGGIQMWISNDSDFSTGAYEAYTTSKSWSLTSGDGTKTVYIKFKDTAGNVSSSINDTIILDTTAPSGTVTINGGDTSTNSTSATLTINATDANSVSQMEISESATFVGASYEAYATSKSFTLSSGDGTKTVYIRFKDSIGNESSSTSDTIILDTAAPTGAISINSGSAYTNSTSSTLTISATDGLSSVDQMEISESATFVGASYEAYSTSKSFTLSSGDGSKTVYIRFKDNLGNVSTTYSDSITLDTAAPTGSISINNGDATTTSATVNLNISASDTLSGVNQMMISQAADFSGASYEAYSTSKSISLTGGDGNKTVYIRFKDTAGNVSTDYSDTISLDTAVPTGSISIDAGATHTSSSSVTLAISGSDNIGVTQMSISQVADFAGASYEAYSTSKSLTLNGSDGTKTVYIRFKDAAGNVSSDYSDSIVLDSAVPTGSIVISGGSTYATSTTVTLTLAATDNLDSSGNIQMWISNNSDFSTGSYETFAGSKSWTLASSDGSKTVSVRFKDQAGNVSSSYSDTIILDSTAPEISTLLPEDNATEIAITADLVITTSEQLVAQSGKFITIFKAADDSVIETIEATDSQVVISGNTITIHHDTLLTDATDYYVQVEDAAFKDQAGNSLTGITDNSSWNFSTVSFTPITLVSTTPADDSANVDNTADLEIEFSKDVTAISGKHILIKLQSDDSTIETIDADSSQVTVSANIVTIHPSTPLSEQTSYYVLIDTGAFQDDTSADYTGIDDPTIWNFTTWDSTAPIITSVTPINNATDIALTTGLEISFSEDIASVAGKNISIYKYSDDSLLQAIATNSGQVIITNNQASITLTPNFINNTKYYILIDNGGFKDLNNNDFAGISSKNAWVFTTIAAAEIPSSSSSSSASSEQASSSESSMPTSDTLYTLTFTIQKDGLPLGGATVELHSDVQTAVSNADGIVTFMNVPVGEHTIKVIYNGQESTQTISVGGTTPSYNVSLNIVFESTSSSSSSNSSSQSLAQGQIDDSGNLLVTTIFWVIVVIIGGLGIIKVYSLLSQRKRNF